MHLITCKIVSIVEIPMNSNLEIYEKTHMNETLLSGHAGSCED